MIQYKMIWTVTDSEHTEMWLDYNQEYREKVQELLNSSEATKHTSIPLRFMSVTTFAKCLYIQIKTAPYVQARGAELFVFMRLAQS